MLVLKIACKTYANRTALMHFSLNEPSGLDSGASPSLATLAAAQGKCSLIIIVALDSAAGSLKADAVAGMACSALAINQLTLLSAADFTSKRPAITPC